jgi:hypothetical protein
MLLAIDALAIIIYLIGVYSYYKLIRASLVELYWLECLVLSSLWLVWFILYLVNELKVLIWRLKK